MPNQKDMNRWRHTKDAEVEYEVRRLTEDRDTWKNMTQQPSNTEDNTRKKIKNENDNYNEN